MHIGFIVEQSIYGLWSLLLTVIFIKQIRQDALIEFLVNFSKDSTTKNPSNTIILNRIRSTGRTAITIHVGGLIGCILCIIQCVDPFPVLGLYNYTITKILSHVGIAVLFTTMLEAISSLVLKLYVSVKYTTRCKNSFTIVVRYISYINFITAFIAWVVENFITDELIYSDGLYYMYITIIQWVIFVMYVVVIKQLEKYIQSNRRKITDGKYYSFKSVLRKLVLVKYMFVLVLSISTGYQVYTFIHQLENNVRVEYIDKNNYSFPQVPLLTTQIISYCILLYFSYYKADTVGSIRSISEASEQYSKTQATTDTDVQNGVKLEIPNHAQNSLSTAVDHNGNINKVVVIELKDGEVTEISINDVSKRDEEPASDLHSNTQEDIRSNTQEDMKYSIEYTINRLTEQAEAEREGTLDEYLDNVKKIISDSDEKMMMHTKELTNRLDKLATMTQSLEQSLEQDNSRVPTPYSSDEESPRLTTRKSPIPPQLPPFYEDMVPGPGLPSIPGLQNTIPHKFGHRSKSRIPVATFAVMPNLTSGSTDTVNFELKE